jgi:hypothetical protein
MIILKLWKLFTTYKTWNMFQVSDNLSSHLKKCTELYSILVYHPQIVFHTVKPPLISSGSLANFDIQKGTTQRSSIWVERIVTLIYDFGLSTFLTTLRVSTKPNKWKCEDFCNNIRFTLGLGVCSGSICTCICTLSFWVWTNWFSLQICVM